MQTIRFVPTSCSAFLPSGASCKFTKVHQSTLSNGRRAQTAFVARLASRTIFGFECDISVAKPFLIDQKAQTV